MRLKSLSWFSINSLGTAGASVARDVCTQLFDAYKHSLSGKLMRLRAVPDTFSGTKPSKHSKPTSILPGPSKKKLVARAPELFTLFSEISSPRTKGSVTDSGFGRELSDPCLISESSHEASGRSSKKPQNGLLNVGHKKKKATTSENAYDDDWAVIGANWELD